MSWLRTLEAASHVLVLGLIALAAAAMLIGALAARATRMVDGVLIPAVERIGDLGAAWQRLLAAVHTAWARWRHTAWSTPTVVGGADHLGAGRPANPSNVGAGAGPFELNRVLGGPLVEADSSPDRAEYPEQ